MNKSNFYRVVRNTSGVLLSLMEQRRIHIFISENLGYVDIDNRQNLFLVGYFQSYKYFEEPQVKKLMQGISSTSSNVPDAMLELAKKEQPLVVHVRRGDYRKEAKFGLLSKEYYKAAIESQLRQFAYEKIWLFSDEIEYASTLIPRKYQHWIRIVPQDKVPSASTLEIMSYGRGFVLANSSFGYWAAQLSGVPNFKIVAPSPWFRDIVEPRDLVNPKWERINATWEK